MKLFASVILRFILFMLILLQYQSTLAKQLSYVVYMGVHLHGQEVSEYDLHQVKESHYELLGSYLGSSRENAKAAIFYSYTRHINGFAAVLEEEQALDIAKHSKVISVFPNKGKKLHTTRSWDFLGLENDGEVPSYSIWEKARYGEGTIIGNLDTG
ncbi:Subtilisin-like protease SBT5.3 [Bienertia sinuspersici]